MRQQQKCAALCRSSVECGAFVGEHYETLHFHPDTGTHSPGMALTRTAWVRLNRLRTGLGRFCSCLHKWGMAPSAACECGTEEQTVDHVVLHCPIHRPLHGAHGWPDGSGWRDNRMAAQHLRRNLVRPNSGLKELA